MQGMVWRLGDRGGGGCCEVGGGGGGGVIGGVDVVCGDGVDNRVGGVVCRVVYGFVYGIVYEVKAPISTMIVNVPEKDRLCGMRGKFVRDVIVDGGRGEDIKRPIYRIQRSLLDYGLP
ncbi:hypothetical protein Tco_0917742 [Tanacetum coccineum]